MIRRYSAVVAWMLGALCAASGNAVAANLMELYHAAQERDPVFEAARHRLDATRQKLPQARAGLLPQVNLTDNRRRTEAHVTFGQEPEEKRYVRARDLRIEVTQPLVRVQNWVAYTQADWQVTQAEAQFALARQELMLRVSQAYFDLLAARDVLSAAESQREAAQAQLEFVEQGRRAGTVAVTDVHEARSRVELAAAQAIAARSEFEIKRSALELITGPAPGTLAGMRPNVRPPLPQPANEAAWIEAAREGNYQVHMQRAAVEIAEYEVKRSQAGHLPNLDLVGSRHKDYSSGSATSPANLETRSESDVIGLQLSWSLFSGGATHARVREAKSTAYQARAELEAVKRNAAHSARQAYSGVVNGMAQVQAMRQAVVSSKSAVEGNQVGYRVGTRINVDVLNAQQQLYSAERDLARARYETVVQLLRLKAATGGLTEDDLVTVNALLGPG